MPREIWLELQNEIRLQLRLQVRLSLERHYGFMLKHGLDRCGKLLDLGTGDGLFLGKVALRRPHSLFYGVDDKPHMIEDARKRDVANIKCIQADALSDEVEAIVLESCGLMMRYFVLHLPDAEKSLKKILSAANPGTRLWIFDLDIDYCACDPPSPVFDSFRELVAEFCEKNSVEIRTATRLPPILKDAGFELTEVAPEPFSNREVDPDSFAEYLCREAYLYHRFLERPPEDESLNKMKRFFHEDMNPEDRYIRYGMAMIAAVKVGG